MAVSEIKLGLREKLLLGNLEATRDWGYAPEYVVGMWKMMQLEKPEDIILATGENHSIREFVELAFLELNIIIEWQGVGLNEVGIDSKNGKVIVKIDPKYFRPSEVSTLLGNPKKARDILNWEAKVKLKELIHIMVKSDYDKLKKGIL